MKLVRIIYIASISIAISACSKSNKDFVGEYKTQYTEDVIVKNASFYSPSRGEVEYPTGFKTTDLTTLELKFFIDESTNKLSGQGTMNIPLVIETGFRNIPKRTNKDFDIIGEHIVNDTLYFTIQLVSVDTRVDAYLFKDGSKSYLGIDKKFSSKIANGPQFDIKNGKYNQYVTNDPDLLKKFDEFILQQYKKNDSLAVNSTTSEFNKKRLMNANAYYNQMYLKK